MLKTLDAIPATEVCETGTCVVYFLFHWQTLIGGVLAIAAALIAGVFVRAQIKAADRIEKERLRRREVAARAVLPLTLSAFMQYAERCAAVLATVPSRRFYEATEPGEELPPLAAPELSQQMIGEVERMIEATGDQRVIKLLSALASHTQTVNSIIRGVVAEANGTSSTILDAGSNLDAYAVRVARIYAIPGALFKWARGATTAPEEMTWDRIESGLRVLDLAEPDAAMMITKARRNGTDPLD